MDPNIINPLIDIGPVGVLLVLVITGFLVPKPYYEREVKRADKATDAAEKNADALKALTDEIRANRAGRT